MKSKILCDGNDGTKAITAGSEYDGDSEWHRRMLINGLAEPLDEQAKKIAAHPGHKEAYGSAALKAVADNVTVAASATARRKF